MIGEPVVGSAAHVALLELQGDGVDPGLIPLVGVTPLQQIARGLAVRRGVDPDRPPGLAKVTKARWVERIVDNSIKTSTRLSC